MFFTRGKIRLRSRRKYSRRGCVCFQARRRPLRRGSRLFLAENNGAQSETTPVALASSLYLCMKPGGSCSARPFFDPPSSRAPQQTSTLFIRRGWTMSICVHFPATPRGREGRRLNFADELQGQPWRERAPGFNPLFSRGEKFSRTFCLQKLSF